MKTPSMFLAVTLAALPALAQELPPERWQVGIGFNAQESVQEDYLNGTSQYLRYNRKDSGAPALLLGYRALDLETSHLSVTGEYQFRNRADLETTNIGGALAGQPGGQSTSAYRMQFWAPGVSWDFRRTVDFGFGLQYRFARLEGLDAKENHHRPWLNAYLGYTFRTRSRTRPFVALRQAVALNRTRATGFSDLATDGGTRRMLRALDANTESALQVGVRF